MEIVIRKDRGEPVGVFKLALAAVGEPDAQTVGKDLCRPGERRFKEAVRVDAFKSNDGAWVRSRAGRPYRPGFLNARQKSTDGNTTLSFDFNRSEEHTSELQSR